MLFKRLWPLLLLVFFLNSLCFSQEMPLTNGFAHNDYLHKRPLFDALDNGYTNIEADVFLRNDKLIVAHFFPYFKGSRTLESLYFKPLTDYIKSHGGEVYQNYNKPIVLMIDLKSSAEKTYLALKPLLVKYAAYLSHMEEGKFVPGNITVILSGHKPGNLLRNENVHLAFLDEDLTDVTTKTTGDPLSIIASCKFSSLIKWDGKGSMPAKQQDKLMSYIKSAHDKGLLVRLWAIPDRQNAWATFLNCGIDLINTDKLSGLRNYLSSRNLIAGITKP